MERGNRRFRKAQRSVYSVRTPQHIRQRIALDMERDQRVPGRHGTIKPLPDAAYLNPAGICAKPNTSSRSGSDNPVSRVVIS